MSQGAMVAVTSSRAPYLYDLPHVLSLPYGFEARFRYFVDWVSPDVARRVEGGETFKGRELALVFHSLETAQLLPFRCAEVILLERIGPMYHLRFVTRDFPDVSQGVVLGPDRESSRQLASSTLSKRSVELLELKGHALSEPLPKAAFLRETKHGWKEFSDGGPSTVATSADQRWAAIASLVMEEPNLEDVPMFFLQGVVNRKGEVAEPVEMQNDFAKGGQSGSGYRLTSGTRYRLKLIQWKARASEVSKETRVVCTADPAKVTLEGQSDLVLGKYDVLEYAIRAEAPGYSELSLKIESEGGAGSSRWPQLYAVRVPIEVRRSGWKTAGIFVLGLIGLVLFVLPVTPVAAPWFGGGVTALTQLVGLALLFTAYGGFLSGYVRFASQAGKMVPGNVPGDA